VAAARLWACGLWLSSLSLVVPTRMTRLEQLARRISLESLGNRAASCSAGWRMALYRVTVYCARPCSAVPQSLRSVPALASLRLPYHTCFRSLFLGVDRKQIHFHHLYSEKYETTRRITRTGYSLKERKIYTKIGID